MDWQERERRRSQLPGIEKRLASALDDARRQHEQAKREFEIASAEACRIGLNRVDGATALRKASAEYDHSLNQYQKALTQFCDFVLWGRIPPDEQA